jgi:hypothetical protein
MVPEVRDPRRLFMRAIGAGQRPGELGREQEHQQHEEKPFHRAADYTGGESVWANE